MRHYLYGNDAPLTHIARGLSGASFNLWVYYSWKILKPLHTLKHVTAVRVFVHQKMQANRALV